MKKIYQTVLFTLLFLLAGSAAGTAQEQLLLSFTPTPTGYLESLSDKKITPDSAYASNYYKGTSAVEGKIEYSIDGNMGTYYHSAWDNYTTFPITLKYFFKNVEQIDYLTYYPRQGHTNGNFKEFELYYTDKDGVEHQLGSYDFKGSSTPNSISFDTPLLNPTEIKFVVKSGMGDNQNGFASCAEMEFYRSTALGVDLEDYFTDSTCSEVIPGITREEILADPDLPAFFKQLAVELLSGSYPFYRTQRYEAYRPINDLASELKLSTYNTYENPTGILVQKGEPVYVFFGDANGEDVSLAIRNWDTNESASYLLKRGMNRIVPAYDGLSYISYFTPNYLTAEPVRAHIIGGSVNGYFDRNRNTAEEWQTILNSAQGEYMDILGNYTNCCFHVASLKSNCPVKGMELIQLYDTIVGMQYEQMGLFKYNRVPKNKMLGRNMSSGFMHADGLGAAFHYNTMSSIGNPDVIVTGDNSWGIAHEYGHVNQVRPGVKWVGTTEVTNNIYSSYAQYMLTSTRSTLRLRLEHESCTDIKDGGTNVFGGRFNSHLHYGVLMGDKWLFQWGQDGGNDHFVKLVPLWQLNLYFKVAKAPWRNGDWFADICEEVRNTSDKGVSNGQHQINFIKMACKYTKTDLTEFFERAGMLKPIDLLVEDYTRAQLTITEAMCEEVRAYVAENKWEKPAGVINYISGNTVGVYEQQLPVEGTLNTGVSGSGTYRTVNHSVWKNAVVYETYAGDEVIRLTMAGTGTRNNASTRVPYPSGSTKIVAVAWNGEKTTVYQP